VSAITRPEILSTQTKLSRTGDSTSLRRRFAYFALEITLNESYRDFSSGDVTAGRREVLASYPSAAIPFYIDLPRHRTYDFD
jgi:hypothetical protein